MQRAARPRSISDGMRTRGCHAAHHATRMRLPIVRIGRELGQAYLGSREVSETSGAEHPAVFIFAEQTGIRSNLAKFLLFVQGRASHHQPLPARMPCLGRQKCPLVFFYLLCLRRTTIFRRERTHREIRQIAGEAKECIERS